MSDSSLCSFDSNASSLAYYSCPRQINVCGSKEVITVDDGGSPNILELFPDWNMGSMVNGAVCRYRLVFPYLAKDYDEIKVEVGLISNAVAFLVETPEFKSDRAKQVRLGNKGDTGTVSFPGETFLTVVADASSKPAEYQFQLTFRQLSEV